MPENKIANPIKPQFVPAQQKSGGTYRFHEQTLVELSIGGFDGESRMHPDHLKIAMQWISANGKKHGDGSWSVDSKLLQPGNAKDKNSLYNHAMKKFPKDDKAGWKLFCTDVLQMVKEADDIRKANPKGRDNLFIKST